MRGPGWCWLAAGVALAGLGGAAAAQDFQYVITFDAVVRHPGELVQVPAIVHAERLAQQMAEGGGAAQGGPADEAEGRTPGASPDLARADRRDPLTGRERPVPRTARSDPRRQAADRRAGRPPGTPPAGPERGAPGQDVAPAMRQLPHDAMAFAPGQGSANPSFLENGFLVEAFWSVRTGTPDGHFIRAHFHPGDLATGFEAQHYGSGDELHGIYIRAADGKPFRLKSVRYRVTRNRQIPRHPRSIHGFSNFNVQVLIGTSFDPRLSIRSQFVGFPVGMSLGNDPDLPWSTLSIIGLDRVTQVYIGSSASVDLDDIVVARWEPAPGDDAAARHRGSEPKTEVSVEAPQSRTDEEASREQPRVPPGRNR
jgi:hypothetical protein